MISSTKPMEATTGNWVAFFCVAEFAEATYNTPNHRHGT